MLTATDAGRRVSGSTLMLVGATTTSLMLTLLAIGPGLAAMSAPIIGYSLATTAVSLLGLFNALFGGPRPRVLMATFFVFCYFWFGLSPILSFRAGSFPGGNLYTDDQLSFVYQLLLVGIAAYVGCYRLAAHLAWKPVDAPRQPVEGSGGVPRWHQRLPMAALVVCAVSLAVWWSLGGFDLTFTTRYLATRRIIGNDASSGAAAAGIKLAIMRVPPAMMLLATLVARRATRDRFLRWTLPGLLILVNAMVSSPFSTPRQWIGAIAVAALLVSFPRPRSIRLTMLALVLGVVLIFPALGGFRRGSDLDLGNSTLTESLGTALDFDAMATTVDATTAVAVTGPQGGRQLIGSLTFYVPRSVWPDKPRPSGEYIFEHSPTNNYRFSNMSVTLWAEGYIDFGVLGTVVYLGALGFVSSRLESRRDSSRVHLTREVILIPMLAGYQFIFLRGALLPTMSTMAAILVSYRIVVWAIGPVAPLALDRVTSRRAAPSYGPVRSVAGGGGRVVGTPGGGW